MFASHDFSCSSSARATRGRLGNPGGRRLAAPSRTSCEIFIEQNLGPRIEQQCTSLALSAGSVRSWTFSSSCPTRTKRF
jgi:hypothetical protein